MERSAYPWEDAAADGRELIVQTRARWSTLVGSPMPEAVRSTFDSGTGRVVFDFPNGWSSAVSCAASADPSGRAGAFGFHVEACTVAESVRVRAWTSGLGGLVLELWAIAERPAVVPARRAMLSARIERAWWSALATPIPPATAVYLVPFRSHLALAFSNGWSATVESGSRPRPQADGPAVTFHVEAHPTSAPGDLDHVAVHDIQSLFGHLRDVADRPRPATDPAGYPRR